VAGAAVTVEAAVTAGAASATDRVVAARSTAGVADDTRAAAA
jgi:hypothetical protein